MDPNADFWLVSITSDPSCSTVLVSGLVGVASIVYCTSALIGTEGMYFYIVLAKCCRPEGEALASSHSWVQGTGCTDLMCHTTYPSPQAAPHPRPHPWPYPNQGAYPS